MMQLRPYQKQAVEAVYDHLRRRDDNPCVAIPTGGGKSAVISTVCRDAVQLWNGRVLILAHVKELLEQAAEKLRAIAPDLSFGIYSAGLKQRDLGYPVTIAGIQSVYRRAAEIGPVDLIIVDESHLIPPSGEGMYQQLLTEAKVVNPNVRVIGLTATPFRMTTGMICAPENILNHVCYQVGVKELIVQGYLCPLRSKAGKTKVDTSSLHIRGGEFIAGEVEDLMDGEGLVQSACDEIIEQTSDRRSVLVFTSGVRHGEHVTRVLRERDGANCGFVEGNTPAKVRDELIGRFKRGELKYLVNVNVLTTGFDAPNVDCVALLRPTMSPGLMYQMIGRGFRLHDGKQNCIAEGQQVLTDRGLIPIEHVTTDMRVWDGEEFVAHHGTVYQGVREVIEYAGLTATPDHQVWTQAGWKAFGQCALEQIPLGVTGDEGKIVWQTDGHFRCGSSCRPTETSSDVNAVSNVRDGGGERLYQSDATHSWMQTMQPTSASRKMACATGIECQRPMHESSQSTILRLRGTRDRIPIQDTDCDGGLGSGESWPASEPAIGPDRQQRSLRGRQPSVRHRVRKPTEHPTATALCRVWDILNAGPRHRFTCEGLLVSNCLILDYGGNILRHGPVDDLRVKEPGSGDSGEAPAKECPQCQAVIHAAYAVCPECGYEFPPPQRQQHEATATTAGVLSGQVEVTDHEVQDVYFSVHAKRGADPDHPRTMRVEYRVGLSDYFSEWICCEHPPDSFPYRKARDWWRRRSNEPFPTCAEEAVDVCESGGICETKSIRVRRVAGEKFPRIVGYELGSIPPRLDGRDEREAEDLPAYAFAEDEIPF